MSLFILTETSAGYALLKAKDKKLFKREQLPENANTAEGVLDLFKLKKFTKFDSAAAAVEEATSLVESKVTPRLASLLDVLKDEKKASLAVADPKLANAIGKLPGLSLQLIADTTTADAFRAIRENLTALIPTLGPNGLSTMALGLSHSLARHKLKFSTDKIDTMVVQAIGLLDDLDKELNIYAMRVKEWYGWHFPELAKILNDNIAYSRLVVQKGLRSSITKDADLSDILPDELSNVVKEAAAHSMGTEIQNEDLETIQALADEVINLHDYRRQLGEYLTARMQAIAPNLTALVGDLVGARLIAHAGSLNSLAKSPASTLQILGAEKALFRALKTKHDTPKYGLIYHASLIGQATGRNKGKMARILAAKASLGIRVDALSEWSDEVSEEQKAAMGTEARFNLERKLAGMEGKPMQTRGVTIAPNGEVSQPKQFAIREARKYNADADAVDEDEPSPAKKSKKSKLVQEVDEDEEMDDASSSEESEVQTSSELEKMAAKCGLSVKRYERKLERGEITFDSNGNPSAVSKKDVKKSKKAEKKAEKEDGKKRKRSDEGESKKKSKKSKSKGSDSD
ncbi:nucleolar protein 58 [Penicillium taxi]|uniref:nucleolar protein 58 n=1 Tax=Penicillium taxi TaxID=168475 RepID=UPI002544FFE1|nr:nucleolar protein 58 [Penicillium taxi]KAJ5888564.1 nucleolar protein 58 [Penicillium taxi]